MQNCFFLFLPPTVTASAVLLPNQPNRDKSSTRKFDVGVFTQPGSKAEVSERTEVFRFTPIADIARHRRRYPQGVAGRGWGYAEGKQLGFGARPSAQGLVPIVTAGCLDSIDPREYWAGNWDMTRRPPRKAEK